MNGYGSIVASAPEIVPDALVPWKEVGYRRDVDYSMHHAFISAGVVWALIARKDDASGKRVALSREDVAELIGVEEPSLRVYLCEGVDGGFRVPKIKCDGEVSGDAYWAEALAFLPDGRACRRVGRPLLRLSIAKGEFLAVDVAMSSSPMTEAKTRTSFGIDRAGDLTSFVASLSSNRRFVATIPDTSAYADAGASDETEFLSRARRSIIGEMPHDGLKVLPIDVVGAYADLIGDDGRDTAIEAILRMGNALGVDPTVPIKARRANPDDFNKPLDRMSAIVELAYRRIVHFGLSSSAGPVDQELASFSIQGVS